MVNDSGNPTAQDSDAPTGFFGSTFGQWFIGYFLVALVWLGVDQYRRGQERAEERARINQAVQDTRDAVRRGEGGDAVNRLFAEEHEQFLEDQRGHKDDAAGR